MMERAPQPVREMLALLRESGHTPYLVGGCVRDLLRGAEPDDYDMTSDARQAQNAERILGKAPRRVAHTAQDARAQVRLPAEGIDERSLR